MKVKKLFDLAYREMPLSIPKKIGLLNLADLRIRDLNVIAKANSVDPLELALQIFERRCRKCGCTQSDCSQCIEKTGSPCSWVEEDLCSACEKK
jgi:hypothetical protein